MALALNNLQRVDMPLNKETKLEAQESVLNLSLHYNPKSATSSY